VGVSTPLTKAEIATIRKLHGQGKSRNDIARELQRSGSTISRTCMDLGLRFDRTRIAAATEARKADAAARRSELELRLLEEADLFLEELHAPYLAFSFGGKDNTYAEELHDEPDATSKLKLMQSAGIAIDRALKLADTGDAGVAAGKSMLGALAKALKVAADDMPGPPAQDLAPAEQPG
jgi:transposase